MMRTSKITGRKNKVELYDRQIMKIGEFEFPAKRLMFQFPKGTVIRGILEKIGICDFTFGLMEEYDLKRKRDGKYSLSRNWQGKKRSICFDEMIFEKYLFELCFSQTISRMFNVVKFEWAMNDEYFQLNLMMKDDL